jgi:hypothetical protein
VHGSPTATCTPRTCRFRVTCNETTDPRWEGEPCGAAVGLGFREGRLLTRPVFVQQNERGETSPYAPAERVLQLRQGETRTLGLRTVRDARLRIKRALGKGKRTLRGGYWEAMRYQYPIRGSDGHIDGFALEVGPLEKIRIKRRFGSRAT